MAERISKTQRWLDLIAFLVSFIVINCFKSI